MANVTYTEAQVGVVYLDDARNLIYSSKITETVVAGQVLCWAADGRMSLADGNDAALDEPQGLALQSGVANDKINVLKRGRVYGFAVSGLNVGGKITLTDTPGVVEEAGSGECCGRIVAEAGAAAADRVVEFDFATCIAGVG